MPMQAGKIRLTDRRDQVPREKLSAVRVPREHEVYPFIERQILGVIGVMGQ